VTELFDELAPSVDAEPLIRALSVVKLFGRYSYDLQRPAIDGVPSRLMLLHGDNGSGKTTLLQMIWHLLSPADDRGHRTAIAKIPFQEFRLDLATGQTIDVKKAEELTGPYTIAIKHGEELVAEAKYGDDTDLDVWRNQLAHSLAGTLQEEEASLISSKYLRRMSQLASFDDGSQVLDIIRGLGIAPYMLADDRNLHSDELELDRERQRTREGERRLSPSQRWQRVVSQELEVTLGRVNDLFRQMTLGAQNVGSASANTIYTNVLNELAHGALDAPTRSPNQLQEVRHLLTEVSKKAPRFAEFGLVPLFESKDFMELLDDVPEDRQYLAANIMFPYLDSLRARYEALEEAERLIRLLLTHANSYLEDKWLTFTLRQGVRIHSDLDESPLEPALLSSGERQLVLLLLSTTLMAGRGSRLFIIDEPELSLSVPWQRRILDSLLACTEGTALQFIVATHSIEMVTANRPSLVRLQRANAKLGL
jgi:predicted ATPase